MSGDRFPHFSRRAKGSLDAIPRRRGERSRVGYLVDRRRDRGGREGERTSGDPRSVAFIIGGFTSLYRARTRPDGSHGGENPTGAILPI